jgi:proteasome lid subunit RPN8/RPN11
MPKIPRAIVDAMIAHAVEEAAKQDEAGNDGIEACGLIHASDGVPVAAHRVTNLRASRFVYEMDGMEVERHERARDASGESLFAIYHSHVASPAYPSATDRSSAFFPPLQRPDPEAVRDLAPEEIRFPDADPDRLMYPDAYYILVSLQHEQPSVRAYRIGGDAMPVEYEVEIV